MASTLPTASGSLSPSSAGWQRSLRDFWRWWTDELRVAFAPVLRRAWDDPSAVVTLRTDGEQLDPLLTRVKITGKHVRLLVAPSLALTKTVVYPAAVAENLIEVIANDIDRQTPFSAEQTYFGARVLAHTNPTPGDDAAARLEVALTVVPRRAIKGPVTAVNAAGATVSSIVLADVAGTPSEVELLPAKERPQRGLTRQQKINLVLLAVVVLGLLLLAVTPALLARARVHALTPLVGKAAAEAETTRRIESAALQLSKMHEFVTSKKYTHTPLIEVVDELSKLSPDTSWLQSFEMKTLSGKGKDAKQVREVQLMGETASASKMIEALEASKLLQNATQRAQTTRGVAPGSERFQVATEIKPRPLPERVEIAALTAPLPAAVPAPVPGQTPVPPAAVPAPPAAASGAGPAAPPAKAGDAGKANPPTPKAPAIQTDPSKTAATAPSATADAAKGRKS